MRLIDADALKKKLGMYYGITCYCADGVVDSIENEIDSATTIDRWIPVTERLPEKNGMYLATVNVNGKWKCDYLFLEVDYLPKDYVKAWMPLPKPYEEGAGK